MNHLDPADLRAIDATISAGSCYSAASVDDVCNSFPMVNAMPSALRVSGNNPRIETDTYHIDLNDLVQTIEVLKERLLVITPQFEKHELYPALKQAYDNYQMIDVMLRGMDGSR